MRNLLTSLVLLFVVAGLSAQEPTPADGKEEGKAQPAEVQRQMAELRRQLSDLEEKAAAIQQARNEQTADYKVKLATLEAENKLKVANLERDSVRITAVADRVNRELIRRATEAQQQQLGDGKPCPSAEAVANPGSGRRRPRGRTKAMPRRDRLKSSCSTG